MEVTILQDNSFAIYQVKEGQDYHMLRFASMDELKRDGLRLRRDVHKVLTAAEGNMFTKRTIRQQHTVEHVDTSVVELAVSIA